MGSMAGPAVALLVALLPALFLEPCQGFQPLGLLRPARSDAIQVEHRLRTRRVVGQQHHQEHQRSGAARRSLVLSGKPESSSEISRRLLLGSAAATWASIAWGAGVARAAAPVAEKGRTQVLGDVEHSPNDTRAYRAIVLPNGLRVLLIRDAETKQAGAALDCHVGHFSDPPDVPGLAHFCEHMLFLGTKKYPEEGSYAAFLGAHGGSSNAYTDTEDTVYYFDINSDYLQPALDRFAQFFITPQFTASATARELNAIESEHSKNLQSDGFRTYQLQKARASPLHPYSKFGTGNKETLEIEPHRLGFDVRDRLLQFYRENYGAERMTLCVAGKESLDQQQRTVEQLFAAVPNRGAGTGFVPRVQAFPKQEPLTVYNIVPVNEVRLISLNWPYYFKDADERQRIVLSHPDQYIGSLLGHEGKGSLLSYFKSKDWASSLGVEVSGMTDDFMTFQCDVDVTPRGFQDRYKVIEGVFSYLGLVRARGVPDYTYDERKALSRIGWQFQEKSAVSTVVGALASNLQEYPPAKVISGPVLLDQPDKQLVASLLAAMTPDNLLLTVLSKDFAKAPNLQRERWYGTQYQVERVPAAAARAWTAPRTVPALFLPTPNPFVPRDLSVKTPATRKRSAAPPPPTVVGDSPAWLVNYRADDVFGQPKAYAYFELVSAGAYASAGAVAALKLFQMSLDEALREYSYDAATAGLSYSLDFTTRGARLAFGGWSDRMPDFIAAVAAATAAHAPRAGPAFDRFKDVVRRDLAAFDNQQPYVHALTNAALCLEEPKYPIADVRAALEGLTADKVAEVARGVFSRCFGVSLLQGNLLEPDVKRFVTSVESGFQFEPLPKAERPERRVVQVPLTPKGEGCLLRRPEPNKDADNSAATLIFQVGGRDPVERVLLELLCATAEDAFYESLRTRQQLGYLVFSGARRTEGVSAAVFAVQSGVRDPAEVAARVLEFLRGWRAALAQAPVAAFAAGLAAQRTEPDQRLAQEATRNWDEIIGGEFKFDRRVREAQLLQKVTTAQLLAFFDKYIAEGGEGRRCITSQVWCKRHAEAAGGIDAVPVPVGATLIDDPVLWRRRQQLYPPIEGKRI